MSNTLKITLRVELRGGKFIKQGSDFEFPGDFGKFCVKKRLAVSVTSITTCLFWYFYMDKHPRVVLEKKSKTKSYQGYSIASFRQNI